MANNIGNLLNRTLNMLLKYFNGEIKEEFITSADNELAQAAVQAVEKVKKNFDKMEVAEAAAEIINLADITNKYVNDKAPWTLAKNGQTTECAQILYNVLEMMKYIAVLLYPYCPNIASDIWSQLGKDSDISKVKIDAPEFLNWGSIKKGVLTTADKVKPVFLRLESDIAGQDKKKQKV